jgi:hypothetical protein
MTMWHHLPSGESEYDGYFQVAPLCKRSPWLSSLYIANTKWPSIIYKVRIRLWCIFKNISVISWQSVFVVEETGIPGENHWPVVSHLQIVSHNVISSTIIYTKAVVYGSHSLH